MELLAERSKYYCGDCGTKLTFYYPKELEEVIFIEDKEFNHNEPTYRCNKCGNIEQFYYAQMIDSKKKLLIVKCFVIEHDV